jgi:hypothetical protein
MVRSIVLSAALIFGLASAASASIAPAPLSNATPIIKVAEGCGAGWWRGPEGHCHPMAVGHACPPGYHLGPEGKKCWPN